ncbi:hypothetical protein OOK58_02620 [Streptomyces sp. NBC_01728]|uniref:hypothetical protein n=1 Tax=unclassified Streptomyces TaxID=2593676 RepID=UPI0022549490|nr:MULTISPECIES: hypothetical protein [unclassified Streptomyces]MCX4461570.1 hypothetical protein [Streptomyces sp. NBC_01719]MCX4490477.1 hypothetical protein [Streptomyces sp. NBC_01728]
MSNSKRSVTGEQAETYGKFAEKPTRPELERFFLLDNEDRKPNRGIYGARWTVCDLVQQ